jgi:circadian clock protein KaiC
MSDTDDTTSAPLERVSSGLPGLDAILCGGFLRGGVYMLLARPGSGKTILANQISFRHVASGGRALVVTLLAESHARLVAQLRAFTFFDPGSVGAALTYVAGYQALEKDKLKGLLDLLRRSIRDHRATLLVIDGLVTAGSLAESELETKKFIHELQVFVELVGCTALLLTGVAGSEEQYALRTMVDGLLELRLDSLGMEATRSIEINKFRGSNVLLGRHFFTITEAGLTLYPRTESRAGVPSNDPGATLAPAATFGIEGLDTMLAGGLRPGSITMVLGAPGSGKTLLGLSLLAAGARRGERGLYFGFFETPADLTRRADAIGMGLGQLVTACLVGIMWQSPLEAIADALAERLVAAIREGGVRRVFIDGLGGFKDTLVYRERTGRFFTALCHDLRALGIVTLLSDETGSLHPVQTPEHGLTALLDTVVCLRHVELRGQRRKVISVTKMRDGAGDPFVRAFSIDARGFKVEAAAYSAETLAG